MDWCHSLPVTSSWAYPVPSQSYITYGMVAPLRNSWQYIIQQTYFCSKHDAWNTLTDSHIFDGPKHRPSCYLCYHLPYKMFVCFITMTWKAASWTITNGFDCFRKHIMVIYLLKIEFYQRHHLTLSESSRSLHFCLSTPRKVLWVTNEIHTNVFGCACMGCAMYMGQLFSCYNWKCIISGKFCNVKFTIIFTWEILGPVLHGHMHIYIYVYKDVITKNAPNVNAIYV